MAADWIGISSSHYDSHCGDSYDHTPQEALDGTDYWGHVVDEVHWLILDLGQTYTITKVRGRSNTTRDPIDVDVYVSDDKASWGTAVATGISTWQDTTSWVEIDTTDKDGRYIKIEIKETEYSGANYMYFGAYTPFIIFDAYGEVAAAGASIPIIMHHRKMMGGD